MTNIFKSQWTAFEHWASNIVRLRKYGKICNVCAFNIRSFWMLKKGVRTYAIPNDSTRKQNAMAMLKPRNIYWILVDSNNFSVKAIHFRKTHTAQTSTHNQSIYFIDTDIERVSEWMECYNVHWIELLCKQIKVSSSSSSAFGINILKQISIAREWIELNSKSWRLHLSPNGHHPTPTNCTALMMRNKIREKTVSVWSCGVMIDLKRSAIRTKSYRASSNGKIIRKISNKMKSPFYYI